MRKKTENALETYFAVQFKKVKEKIKLIKLNSPIDLEI